MTMERLAPTKPSAVIPALCGDPIHSAAGRGFAAE